MRFFEPQYLEENSLYPPASIITKLLVFTRLWQLGGNHHAILKGVRSVAEADLPRYSFPPQPAAKALSLTIQKSLVNTNIRSASTPLGFPCIPLGIASAAQRFVRTLSCEGITHLCDVTVPSGVVSLPALGGGPRGSSPMPNQRVHLFQRFASPTTRQRHKNGAVISLTIAG